MARNGSSVVAFKVGERAASPEGLHFQLTAAHGDSPTFKVKSVPVVDGPEGALCLDTEPYGGMIDYSWFDRPLSLAGRVLVQRGDKVESRLVSLEQPIAMIPSLAIHLDRGVNDGFAPNRATDLCPMVSAGRMDAAGFEVLLLAPRWMGNWHCQRMRGALCFLKASSGRRVLFALRFAALRPGFLGRGELGAEPHPQAAALFGRARLE